MAIAGGLDFLLRVSASAAAPTGEGADLGTGIASGEMPQPQACVLYILRVGVVERLGELGQVLLPSMALNAVRCVILHWRQRLYVLLNAQVEKSLFDRD